MRFDMERVASAAPELETLTELRPARSPGGAGELLSPPVAAEPFDRAILSWNGQGTWRFDLRVRIGDEWSPWCVMGHMDGDKLWSAPSPPEGNLVSVETDILRVRGGKAATAFQARAEGAGDLRCLNVAHFRQDGRRRSDAPSRAWGVTLPVPERSQTVEDPKVRGLVCSPTSVAMVLAYHGRSVSTAGLAKMVFDHEARIYGNWPINTAVAAKLLSGWACVARLPGFAELEDEIAARRPVVISHRWRPGELSNAPISRSSGHLIVVAGFTEQGDVVVNDPAAKPGQVRRVYKRGELFRTWQERSGGVAYLIRPARA